MLPILHSGDLRFRFGPYVIDMKGRRVDVSPWPEWMGGSFLNPFAVLDPVAWEPVKYVSRADGGVWLISNEWKSCRHRHPVLYVLFLSRSGDLTDHAEVHLQNTVSASVLQVFREWTLVGDVILRGTREAGRLIPSRHEVYPVLENGRARLGPGGLLLLPDGRSPGPGGWGDPVFDPVPVLQEIRSAVGAAKKTRSLRVIHVLGWDEERVWLVAGGPLRSSRSTTLYAVAGVVRSAGAGTAVEVIEAFTTRHDLRTFHLNDGGWVVGIPKQVESDVDPEPNADDRWLVLLPGHGEVFRVDLSGIPGCQWLSAEQFATDPEIGLISVASAPCGRGRWSTILRAGDGKKAEVFRAFDMHAIALYRSLLHGWMFIRDDSGKGRVFAGAEPGYKAPGTFTQWDLLEVIHQSGRLSLPVLKGIVHWHGTLMACGVENGHPCRMFLAFFRISGDSPHLLRLIESGSGWIPEKIELAADDDILNVVLRITREGGYFSTCIRMGSDGSFTISHVA